MVDLAVLGILSGLAKEFTPCYGGNLTSDGMRGPCRSRDILREHFKIRFLKIHTSASKVTHTCLNYFRSALGIGLAILLITLIHPYTLGVDWSGKRAIVQLWQSTAIHGIIGST